MQACPASTYVCVLVCMCRTRVCHVRVSVSCAVYVHVHMYMSVHVCACMQSSTRYTECLPAAVGMFAKAEFDVTSESQQHLAVSTGTVSEGHSRPPSCWEHVVGVPFALHWLGGGSRLLRSWGYSLSCGRRVGS